MRLMIRAEWGRCCVCGRMRWLYSVKRITVMPRCFGCWRDAANSGLISKQVYEKIRKHANNRE